VKHYNRFFEQLLFSSNGMKNFRAVYFILLKASMTSRKSALVNTNSLSPVFSAPG